MPRNIAPSVAISEGGTLTVRLYDATQLTDLARQCDSILSTVREHSPRLVGTQAGVEADEIERAIERILNRVLVWAGYGDAASFFRQNEIQKGIHECYRELTACSERFTIALSMVDSSENRMREKARERDHRQLFDVLVEILDELRQSDRSTTSTASEVPALVESLPVLQQAIPIEMDSGLSQLVVVPSRSRQADLSGKVFRASGHAVMKDAPLTSTSAALGRLRDQSPTSQTRFKERIETWLSLQHRNVLSFFGHVKIEDVVYSVSPWAENGNIRDYVRNNYDADRMRLLSEVAAGMEFLHESGIIHGDLCGKNVLINGEGKAFVCGFNLFEFSNPSSVMSRARWLAPERITSTSVPLPTEEADVWSFGLLCLEVFTGEDPYSSHSDLFVPVLLSQGTPPVHPGPAAVGLSPKMWDLMQSCWKFKPAERPSMATVQSAIRGMLPLRVSRQPSSSSARSPRSFSLPTSLPSTPDIGSSKGADQSSAENSSSSAQPPPLVRPIDPTTDMEAPNRRIKGGSSASSFASPRLPPVQEVEQHCPDLGILASPHPSMRFKSHPSTAPNPRFDLQRKTSVDSSSSQSTSSTGESILRTGKLRWPFSLKRSQTTPNTTADTSSFPSTPGSSNSIVDLEMPPDPKPFPPSRSQTAPAEVSKRVVPHPSQLTNPPISILPSRHRVPVSREVLDFMEKAASDAECLLRPAKDGTVSAANLEGLVSRVITGTADSSTDEGFKATFLTIYQLFATSVQLFGILKKRFESTNLNPSNIGSQYSILLFIESWLKKGFEDEDLRCSSMIEEFVLSVSGSQIMEEKAKEIASLINDPENVCLRRPERGPRLRCEHALRPSEATPSDWAAALTVVEGDRFKSITYWDYVNFIRQRSNTRRIEVSNTIHDLIKIWIQRTVLTSDYLDERMKMYEHWILTAQACRKMNNFSSTSAITTALLSPAVTGLVLTCESKAGRVLRTLTEDLDLENGAYQNSLRQAGTKELIPWLDPHLSALDSTFVRSNLIMEVDGHPLIDFKHCSELAEQIDSVTQYTSPRIDHTTRQDVLAYVEYSLKSNTIDEAAIKAQIATLSAKLAKEEQLMLEHRARMRSLGMPWSPPQRRR
ncbi:hypothetical protein B0F90DRAFT_1816199 [Multifurca ochricompacta]|uniref:Non-specific serine/threonine protein kinase n=1 Tax=Multifurca ochricompacta TaxID=376703 RepID=A0AAD4M868_9AGAM|nr:hypothetical protein B0F90DRAFT_1816199 [Multifurca ochricompacta]